MTEPHKPPSPDVTRRMASEWDARAREDARHYISTGESEGLHFSLAGIRDSVMILEDLFPYLRQDMHVLEIGCGIGRMLQFMAVLFEEVRGIDVSESMVAQAQEFLARFDNAAVVQGDGHSLAPFADASFDLVYSYVVFQHIPDKQVIRHYVEEARRVLKPGGLFKWHVKTGHWEGQGDEPDTWCGVDLTREDIDEWCAPLGLEVLNAYSCTDTTAWVVTRLPA